LNRRAFLATVVASTLMLGGIAHAAVDAAAQSGFDKQVDQAMSAYNAKNSKGFYANWAAMMKSIETEQAFKTLYVGKYMKEFGSYKSRKIIQARSTVSTVNALLVYHAEFSKKSATLSVNFFKEGGAFKIQQITIQ
jgi:hypothetical protein